MNLTMVHIQQTLAIHHNYGYYNAQLQYDLYILKGLLLTRRLTPHAGQEKQEEDKHGRPNGQSNGSSIHLGCILYPK